MKINYKIIIFVIILTSNCMACVIYRKEVILKDSIFIAHSYSKIGNNELCTVEELTFVDSIFRYKRFICSDNTNKNLILEDSNSGVWIKSSNNKIILTDFQLLSTCLKSAKTVGTSTIHKKFYKDTIYIYNNRYIGTFPNFSKKYYFKKSKNRVFY